VPTDVPLKGKNTAATVDCLFRYEMCFRESKLIRRYTLRVWVVTTNQLMDILCVEGTWGLRADITGN
jgi:hypothetical protein